MNIHSISSANVSFGDIKLGVGGAERLAKTIPALQAKILISRNTFVKSDVLISSNNVEVIPPERNMILRISKILANSKHFSDIEIFEHEKRHIFKIVPGISDSDVYKYGINNKQISIAEIIARIIDKNPNWKKFLRSGEKESDIEISPAIKKAAKEIELYNKNHALF